MVISCCPGLSSSLDGVLPMKSLSILPFAVNKIDGQLSCKLLFTGQKTTDWQCLFAFADSVDDIGTAAPLVMDVTMIVFS